MLNDQLDECAKTFGRIDMLCVTEGNTSHKYL